MELLAGGEPARHALACNVLLARVGRVDRARYGSRQQSLRDCDFEHFTHRLACTLLEQIFFAWSSLFVDLIRGLGSALINELSLRKSIMEPSV